MSESGTGGRKREDFVTASGGESDSGKRHCMVVHAYYPMGETRVERQAQALLRSGYQVDVVCLRADKELPYEVVEGVDVYRLPVKRNSGTGPALQFLEYLAFFVLAFVKLVGLHRRQRYHTVQVHNLPDFLVFAALGPKLNGARVLLDIHDLMPEFFMTRFGSSMTSWPARLVIWQEQLSCRFADHVITVSEHWRQTLIRRGVPAQKCSVVMNLADDSIFKWSGDAVFPSQPGPLRLIYHGSLVQRYGLDLAVQAIHQVREEIPDIHLTLIGQGAYADALIEMIRELDLNYNVTIWNEMFPVHQLPQIIRTANLGIVPYRADTFTDQLLPTKLMEYAALGIPAIASCTSAIEAYFRNTMVEFFRPDDVNDLARCIRTLHYDREHLAELGRGSRKFNERYNWTEMGAAYVATVEQMKGG